MPRTIRFIGRVKDEHNYPASLMEDDKTGECFYLYDEDTYQERLRDSQVLAETRPGSGYQILDLPKAAD